MKQTSGLPTGTVTFLFTDIERSTQLLQALGDRYREVLEDHQRLLEAAFSNHGGTVVGTEGDSFFVVFPSAPQAVVAALDAQRTLASHPWPDDGRVRVRMGLHTGEAQLGGGSYVGVDVHRAARIAAAAHGGQVVMSESSRVLAERDLPEGVFLRDLGEHRLKDLLQPEHIFHVVDPSLPTEFPPLVTLGVRANNLPTQPSAFLGREGELASVGDLLERESVRLLTLTGPGGIGKTRLALQAVSDRIERFLDGAYFVDLASVRDPDAAFETILRAVGVTAPGDGRPLDALEERLASQDTLLLLDNFEQVIGAADGLAHLLQRCRRVKALVTSREALGVRGEHVFPVPPLSLPPRRRSGSEEIGGYEAVRLFVERGQGARPAFSLTDENADAVAEICIRLDGLPLAIELAAARLKLFSPHELNERLERRLHLLRGGRDLPDRQKTLRSTIEWSYDLLAPDERIVFSLLSLFPTARVEAVERVTDRLDFLSDVDVVETLASLVDKSLIRSVEESGSRRLSMLDMVREFASERLEEHPEVEEARRAHAEYFSEFAVRRRDRFSEGEVLDELAAEAGNLRAAWRYWVAAGELDRIEDLLDPMWTLYDARGWYSEAVELARDLLGVVATTPSTSDLEARKTIILTGLARGLLAIRGYTKEVEEAYAQALTMLEEAGALPRLFPVLRSLATFHLYRGEFDKAASIGRQLLDLGTQQGDRTVQVEGHLVFGHNLAALGDYETGLEHLNRAIALFDPRSHGSRRFHFGPSPGIVAHTSSAFYLWSLGYPDQAAARASRALDLAAQMAHPFTLTYALFHVGLLDLLRGDLQLVHERATRVHEVGEEHGYDVWVALALILEGIALAGLGRGAEGLARSDQGLALYQGVPTPPVFWPLLQLIRARSFGLAGRPADGVPAIDEAIDAFGDRANVLYPELPLAKGDLLLAAEGPEAAEPWYRQAFEVGGEVGARMAQLIAATRLAQLGQEGGDGASLVRGIYEMFTEGFETPQLAEARAVIEAVQGTGAP